VAYVSLAVGLTVIGRLLGLPSRFVVVGIDVLMLAGRLAMIGLPPLVILIGTTVFSYWPRFWFLPIMDQE
jgi:hypothetical protein